MILALVPSRCKFACSSSGSIELSLCSLDYIMLFLVLIFWLVDILFGGLLIEGLSDADEIVTF